MIANFFHNKFFSWKSNEVKAARVHHSNVYFPSPCEEYGIRSPLLVVRSHGCSRTSALAWVRAPLCFASSRRLELSSHDPWRAGGNQATRRGQAAVRPCLGWR